jgi:hypothetical protein
MTRCAHCKRRIREKHPHVGLVLGDGRELAYHAREACSEYVFERVIKALDKGGGVYGLRHYHVCGDEGRGFDCWAGCFREAVLN